MINQDALLWNKYSFNNQDLLTALTKQENDVLNLYKERQTFIAGEFIFKEGEEPLGLYRVIAGKVKKQTATNLGTHHIFYICKEQEYLGYHALLSEEPYVDAAAALTDCTIEFIPKVDFLKVVQTSHQLAQRLLKNLAHEFGVFLNATKLLAKYTVRERAALNLLILHHKFNVTTSAQQPIVVNREDLANMVGTAKESLVRMLKDFKDEELITSQGRSIFIKDYAGLLKVSNIE